VRELLDRAPAANKKRMIQYQTVDHKLLADGEYFQLINNDVNKFIDDVSGVKKFLD